MAVIGFVGAGTLHLSVSAMANSNNVTPGPFQVATTRIKCGMDACLGDIEALLITVSAQQALVKLFRKQFSSPVVHFVLLVNGNDEIHVRCNCVGKLPRLACHDHEATELCPGTHKTGPKLLYGYIVVETNVLFGLLLESQKIISVESVAVTADVQPNNIGRSQKVEQIVEKGHHWLYIELLILS